MTTIESMLFAREGNIDAIYAIKEDIVSVAELIAKTFKAKNKLFIFGNGGSAADAQHMAAEFVGRFSKDRPGLPAIALTTDTSAITAIANDWDYSYVFTRQLEALANVDDVVLGITTSGKSSNVVRAIEHAAYKGMPTICLTKEFDCPVTTFSEYILVTGGESTQIIQERMLMIEHMICELVDDIMTRSE